ncbi:hypothetical protein EJ05DRAFT_504631 [Pseudovirgaria hyperparasitica]|uniref:Uncharacterized protein n=1 Tax=Pseudovirgaria hyperparasitica TaxID=470096 RepID=A0A6A6VWF4_9PEZI|nr:uncharacterized protein EJ05DRAFT_504631 [Pseudovirgaria hyperparasitica]KAF2754034.1 hypothetical protein EJ05DRAFT_504631 [Pseudovirgaria hyperparasitica]
MVKQIAPASGTRPLPIPLRETVTEIETATETITPRPIYPVARRKERRDGYVPPMSRHPHVTTISTTISTTKDLPYLAGIFCDGVEGYSSACGCIGVYPSTTLIDGPVETTTTTVTEFTTLPVVYIPTGSYGTGTGGIPSFTASPTGIWTNSSTPDPTSFTESYSSVPSDPPYTNSSIPTSSALYTNASTPLPTYPYTNSSTPLPTYPYTNSSSSHPTYTNASSSSPTTPSWSNSSTLYPTFPATTTTYTNTLPQTQYPNTTLSTAPYANSSSSTSSTSPTSTHIIATPITPSHTAIPAPPVCGPTGVCEHFSPCGPIDRPGNPCVCAGAIEKDAICVDRRQQCRTMAPCVSSADCGISERCAVNSCCGGPVCVRIGGVCGNPDIGTIPGGFGRSLKRGVFGELVPMGRMGGGIFG